MKQPRIQHVRLSLMLGLASMTPMISCNGVPTLKPRVKTMDIGQRVNEASAVLLIRTTAITRLGEPVRSPENPLVQLVKVAGDVLFVLKGENPGSAVQYYFFAWADGGYSGPPLEMVAAGDLSVVFLQSDHGMLRAVNDVYLSHLQLLGSSRMATDLGDFDTVASKIAYLMLSPPGGVDQSLYRADLPSGFARSVEIVGCDVARSILGTVLVKNGSALELRTRDVMERVRRTAICKPTDH